ncbi:hypothetical protein MY1884_002223 [Beauveria asiatica]
MPAIQDVSTIAMPSSSPPVSISSYARFMHEHTKRQMEASQLSAPQSSGSSQISTSSSMSNGVHIYKFIFFDPATFIGNHA